MSALLCNLRRFPNIETLIVDFDFHLAADVQYEHWGNTILGLMADDEAESRDIIELKEGDEAWRALMGKTFNAISANQNQGVVRDLVVRMCPIRPSSPFGTEQLDGWLETLESFRFEIYAHDIGACWYVIFTILTPIIGEVIGMLQVAAIKSERLQYHPSASR